MLIDHYLPRYDVTEVQEIEVDAPPAVTYDAIRRADLRDPLISALFALRELPNRLSRRLHGSPPKPALKRFTFADLEKPEMGFMLLAEQPKREFTVGSVGRFWKKDYGWRRIEAKDFADFSEPGYAKLAVGFSVRPSGFGGSTLRYEARTATTDEEARKRFRRYWLLIRPGVAMVMRRALRRIKAETEGSFIPQNVYRSRTCISGKLLAILIVGLVSRPAALTAQDQWAFELRGGPAFATKDLGDASLNTGFGFEGTIGYRVQPHLSVYAGWDWHHFSAEASPPGADNDFEETGYAFGLRFQHPVGQSETAAVQLRGGGTLNHIEVENSAGDRVADSDHGLGWEAGAGMAFRIASKWQVTPGVRFRSLSRDLTTGTSTTPTDLRYFAAEVGFSRTF